jgi:nucleotide-binding universal stress UspA family protein
MLSFRIIVMPTDFSDYSLRALPYAIDLAEKYDARLKVVFVSEPSMQVSDVAWVGVDERAMNEDHAREARRHLEKIILEQVPNDLPADAEILSGNAVDEVIGYAREVNADLIVMATHGRSGVSHMLMGSTAEQVVRKAPCPVLTLKQPMIFRMDGNAEELDEL